METTAPWASLLAGLVMIATAIALASRHRTPETLLLTTLATIGALLTVFPSVQRVAFNGWSIESRIGRSSGWLEMWVPGNPLLDESVQRFIATQLEEMDNAERSAFDVKLSERLRAHDIVTVTDVLAETLRLLNAPQLADRLYDQGRGVPINQDERGSPTPTPAP